MLKVIQNSKIISIWTILFIGLFMRLILINQSFWLDEASQAMTSYRSINDILFNNLADFHPPFMYLLTHFWIMVNASEIWLRLLPVGFGVLTILVGYLLAEKLFSKRIGYIFGLLLALSPYHIYYSQEFRMYSLVTLLVLLSFYYFVRLIKEPITRIAEIGFILSSTLILYTHYLGGSIFIVQLLYVFLFRRKLLNRFFLYFSLVGLLFLAWIPQFYAQLQVGVVADSYLPGWSQMLSLSFYKAIPLLLVKFIIGRLDFNNNLVYLGMIAASFSIVGIGLYPLLKRLKESTVLLVCFWFILPVIITFVLSFKLPMFQPFRLLFCLPALILLLAIGIDSFKRYKMYVLSAVILLFISCQSIFWFNSSFWREDWRSSVIESDQYVGEEGTVLFAWTDSFPPYQFYSAHNHGLGVVQKNPATFNEVDITLSNTPLGTKVVVFNYLSALTDPENNIKKWLELHNYRLIETKNYNGVGFVDYYVNADQLIGLKSD